MLRGNDLINDCALSESSKPHRSADNLAARPRNTLHSVYIYTYTHQRKNVMVSYKR